MLIPVIKSANKKQEIYKKILQFLKFMTTTFLRSELSLFLKIFLSCYDFPYYYHLIKNVVYHGIAPILRKNVTELVLYADEINLFTK